MKKLLLSVAMAVLTVVGMAGVATISPAYAETGTGTGTGTGTSGGISIDDIKPTSAPSKGLKEMAKDIINIVIGVVGVLAVVFMIMGGISFITSQGDTNKVTKARNTILYGVVGLIVAVLAYAIVNFVLTEVLGVSKSGSGTGTGTGTGVGTGGGVYARSIDSF